MNVSRGERNVLSEESFFHRARDQCRVVGNAFIYKYVSTRAEGGGGGGRSMRHPKYLASLSCFHEYIKIQDEEGRVTGGRECHVLCTVIARDI